MAVIRLNDLVQSYRRTARPALDGLTLIASPGEVICLVGHNGAGKSTLFDLIAGVSTPQSGDVLLGVGPREIGWCPQREIVDWSLTVRQNVSLGTQLRTGLHGRRLRDEVAAACDVMGIAAIADRQAETLSGGELRRMQIARAIAGGPRLLLLDEPTTGLDPDGIGRVFVHLREHANAGGTAIVSTHETSRFAGWCDRVWALSHGRLVADEDTPTFLSRSGGDGSDLWPAYLTLSSDESS